MKKSGIILLFLLLQLLASAQNPSSGIIFGFDVGASRLLTEPSSDFRQNYTDFENKSGLAFDIEVSKLFLQHFEVGTSLGISNLQGKMNDPSASDNRYILTGDHYIRDLMGPLRYTNSPMQQKFFIGFYFRSFSKIRNPFMVEPFLRIGGGYIGYRAELSDQSGIISGKGTGNFSKIPMSSSLLFAAAGMKSYFSPNFFMNATLTFDYTGYDYLDAVFNFDASDNRIGLGGIYTEFKIGLFFQTTGNGKQSGTVGGKNMNSLPFSR